MIKLLGMIGGLCFAYSALPAAYRTMKVGKSIGTPIDIAWVVLVGIVTMYLYLFLSFGFDLFLFASYAINGLSWVAIVYYHYFPRRMPVVNKSWSNLYSDLEKLKKRRTNDFKRK